MLFPANNCQSNSIWKQYCFYTTKEGQWNFKLDYLRSLPHTQNNYWLATTLPNIAEEEDFIRRSTPSETELTSQLIPNHLTSDIGSLHMDIKRILRRYDFEIMPLFISHEEYFAVLEDLESLWRKLEACRIEAKLSTIYDKLDHTTSSTSDENRRPWYVPF